MAFIKKDWKCGDTITADDLNRLENGVEEALDGDCGYSCSEGWVTLTEESVTTVKETEPALYASSDLAYSEPITADTIKVTFDGTVYECNKQTHGLGFTYYGTNTLTPTVGAIDWSEYPFEIMDNDLLTENAGTYQVKIESYEETIETSECFDKARGYSCTEGWATRTNESVTTVMEEGALSPIAQLAYLQLIKADTIKVTFDDVEYTCTQNNDGSYGAPWNGVTQSFDWSTYPFYIFSDLVEGSTFINTETAGTYQVKIEEPSIEADVTECFKEAAIYATKEAMKEMLRPLVLKHTSESTLSETFATIRDAYLAGRSVMLDPVVNSKSYYSMISLELSDYQGSTSGGEIVFGGETTQTFVASTASDYPTRKTS